MPLSSQKIIVGDSGLLGNALLASAAGRCPEAVDGGGARQTATAETQVLTFESRSLLAALREGDTRPVYERVARSNAPQHWIYCAGLIDPHSPPEELAWVNAEVPRRLCAALAAASRALGRPSGYIRFVTFGSALEERGGLVAANPYIASKALLFKEFTRFRGAEAPAGAVAWSHIRLHTLYGRRRPPPFMFLGQMEAALRNGTEFAMSAGAQLREYHHADDVAYNVLAYLEVVTQSARAQTIDLDNGCPIRIADLATRVFAHFGLAHRLRIGAMTAQPGEVFEATQPRSPCVVASRDAVQGIISWFTELGIPVVRP